MVSHQHGMTVTKTLRKGEVRLGGRGGGVSLPISPRWGTSWGGGRHSWPCPTQGCPQAPEGAVPREDGAVAVPQGGLVSLQAEPQCWSFSYGRDKMRGLLPEGASLLLLRVLACQQAVPSGLIFPAINTEGHLCTSSYVSHWPGVPVGWGVWVRLGVPGWVVGGASEQCG